jgi:KDO2-lipid IV(A) lauroyltransferase
VVEEIRPPRLFDLFMRVRSAQGLRLIPSNRPAVRVIVAALRRNEIVGLLCDRDVQGTGRALAFFGRPTLLTTAPAALALRTGAVVLPSVAYRQALYRGAGYVGEPIEMPRTGDTEADVQEGSQRIVRCLESLIRAHPEQWTVFTDVWPSAGPGIDDST